jgi:histone-lysine N-methyltransferase SETD3
LHEFFWARLAVITRIFGFEVNNRKTDGLVAMADMLNHKLPNETSWHFDQGLHAFTITTTKRLLKGAQVFDSYGRKCNSRYFVNYGFSLDTNEDNQVALFFSLPRPSDDADQQALMSYQLKAKLIGPHMRRFQIPFEHKEKVTRKCVSFLRVAYANIEELVPLTKLDSLEKIDPISIQNEALVMTAIAEKARETLAGFPTTLEEDNRILAEEKLTMNVRACVLMRRGEREVLQAYIDLDQTIQTVKDMDLRQLKKYLSRHVNNKGPEPTFAWRKEMYFDELWIPLLTGVKRELEEMNNSLE